VLGTVAAACEIRAKPAPLFACSSLLTRMYGMTCIRGVPPRCRAPGGSSRAGATLWSNCIAQLFAIEAEASNRGWTLLPSVEDAGYSAKDLNRPGIQSALEQLDDGDADVLVVAKLDRLSRSMLEFANVMDRAQKRGWGLLALDVAVDTTTPVGEVMANLMAAFAQFERRLIGQRTKEALAIKRAQGVRLGRPSSTPALIADRICGERAAGATLAAISDGLNRHAVPTVRGGQRWQPSSLESILVSS
jgi:DNA invertase Pin-like site-specific DNA recombinase